MRENDNFDELEKLEMPVKPQVTVVDTKTDNRDISDKAISAVENFVNTSDHSHEYTTENVKADKTLSILCYIPFVSLFFLYNKKSINNKYFHFHINQGLILTITWVVVIIIAKILDSLFRKETGYVSDLPSSIYFINSCMFIACILLSIFGINNTVENKSKELPVVGKFKIFK